METQKMAKVKLTREWLEFPAGTVIERHPSEAKWLMMKGIAERVETVNVDTPAPPKPAKAKGRRR